MVESTGDRRRHRLVVERPVAQLLQCLHQPRLLILRQADGESTDDDDLVCFRVDAEVNQTTTPVAQRRRHTKSAERRCGFVEQ